MSENPKNRSGRPRRLDPALKAGAFALGKKAADANHKNADAAPARRQAVAKPRSRFKSLERAKSLEMLRQVREELNLKDPYFRLHEGHAQARTRIDGAELLNFASYDYLGLNADPRPAEAAQDAIRRYGMSASASRMVAGDRPIHRQLEAALAAHFGAEDALTFVSGHATNVSVLEAIVGKGDLVLTDRFIHNSVTVGARLSEASRRSFPHNDMDALERILIKERATSRNVLVVVEGLYSMDGDMPDLKALIELRNRHDTWLMVDEAHALGCVGETGKGTFEAQGVDPSEIDIWMGTLSKTLASTGGFVAGSKELIDYLRYGASGFVYSVALPPAQAAAAFAALRLLDVEPWRARKLRANSLYFQRCAEELGFSTGTAQALGIMPIVVGDSFVAVKLSERMLERGINVTPVTFPGVALDSARLRFFLMATHSEADIETALTALREELDALENSGFLAEATAMSARLAGLAPS